MAEFAELVISAKTDKLKRAKGELNETTVAAGRTDRAVDKTGKAFVKAGAQSKAATGAMAAGMKKAHVAVAALATAALGLGVAIKVIAEFETSISKLGAISGATTKQLAQMRDVAKELGSATEFSAGQAADGLTFLAQAGFTAQESIAAIPAVLDLATASGLGLAAAADTASNIMSGFGIAAGDAARVSDVLAAAASSSNTNVSQLGGAMSTVAPIAAALGIELENTAAAIGIMSDAGIQGERAGTALRGVLAALAGPTAAATTVLKEMGLTIKDVDPATNSLADVLGKLQGAGLSTADAMTIFGREAASGALVLVKGAKQVGTFANELEKADGASKDMAETMRDNLGGDIATLQSSLSGLILALGEAGLTAVLRGVIQLATGVARAFTTIVDAVSSGLSVISDFTKDVFGLKTNQELLAEAVILSNVAMSDQVTQADKAAAAIKRVTQMSIDSARVKLINAQSAADEFEAERNRMMQTSAIFSDLSAKTDEIAQKRLGIALLEERIDGFRRKGLDTTQIENGALEDQKLLLVGLLRDQQDIKNEMESQSFLSSEQRAAFDKTNSLIGILKAGIADSTGVMVDLNGAIIAAADTTGALARLAGTVDFSKATDGAQALSKQLNVSLQTAMKMMGILGAAAQAANTAAVFDPRDPRFSSASNTLNKTRELMALVAAEAKHITTWVPKAADAIGGGGGGLGKAAKTAAKELDAMNREIKRLEFDADPLGKYNSELKRLNVLAKNGLTDGAYKKAVADLNQEFANSSPAINKVSDTIGDFVASGFKDFDALKDSFKNMLKEMISTAISNPIRLALTTAFSGGGSAAGASGAAGAASGGAGGGGMVGILGQMAGIGSALGTGFMSSLGGFMSGGLSGGFGAIGAQLSATAAGGFGLSSVAASIGAVAAPLLAVVAVFSFFKKKTKELDAGLRVTVDGLDAVVDGFKVIQTKRFWGLSKKVSTQFNALDAAVSGPLNRAVDGLLGGIFNSATALGINAKAFENFSTSVSVSTKGLSEDEAQKKIAEALGGIADEFADLVPGISAFKTEGEGANATLSRLSTSLLAANVVLDTIGGSLFNISLSGAGAAASLVGMFGTLENFNNATTTFFQRFFTEQERVATQTRQLTEIFGDLNKTLPTTRQEFRNLVEAQNLNTEAGRAMFATLVSLSGQFDAILPSIDSLSNALGSLVGAATEAALGPINEMVASSKSAAKIARQSADEFFRLADSLRAAASNIGSVTTTAELATAGQKFTAMLAKAVTGDTAALAGLGAAGGSLATDSAGFATSAVDLKRIEATIRGQLQQGAAVSEALGLGADFQALLFDVNTAALEVTRDILASGNLTQDILNEQNELLQNIGQRISDSATLQVIATRDNAGQTIAALLDGSGNVVAGLSREGARNIAASQTQNALFNNSITGQTASIIGGQDLTTQQVSEVAGLQGQTVSITELVRDAVNGNEILTETLINRLGAGINIAGFSNLLGSNATMVSLLTNISNSILLQDARDEAARAAAIADSVNQQAIEDAMAPARVIVAQMLAINEQIANTQAQLGQTPNTVNTTQNQEGPLGIMEYTVAVVNPLIASLQSSISALLNQRALAEGGLEPIREAVRDLGGIPSFANGVRNFAGGLAEINDGTGGEIVNLPNGSQVIPNDLSRRMVDNQGGGQSASSNSESMSSVAMKTELAELRRVMISLVKFTKRISDLERKHDIEGTPPVRAA